MRMTPVQKRTGSGNAPPSAHTNPSLPVSHPNSPASTPVATGRMILDAPPLASPPNMEGTIPHSPTPGFSGNPTELPHRTVSLQMMNQIGGMSASPLSPKGKSAAKNGPFAIGSPFNVEKRLHVDGEFNWFGDGDPREMFDIQEKLGEGAFGAVFKAVLKQTGFVMAIKEILVGKLNDRNSIQKEINMLRQCRHRNTVQYFGCFNVDDDSIWILNDYCGAGSISDCIELTETTFTEPQIAIVLAAALEGLAFLHSRNIVHRDVKCANILLTENAVVKIGDFGVSEKLTQTVCVRNSIVGTPYWMSPEVITGSDYGTEADIWSLGITTIEMTDGVPPHSTVHPMRAMFKIPFLPPPTLLQPSAYSKQFNDFIARCLVKDPKKRPSAQELLQHPFIERHVGQQHNNDLRKPLMEKVREVMARRSLVKKLGHPKGGKTTVIRGDVIAEDSIAERNDLLHASAASIRKPRGLSGSSVGSHATVLIHSEDDGEVNHWQGSGNLDDTLVIHKSAPTYGSPQEAAAEAECSGTMVIHSDQKEKHLDVRLHAETKRGSETFRNKLVSPAAVVTKRMDDSGTLIIHGDHVNVEVRMKEHMDDADVESEEEGRPSEQPETDMDSDVDAEFLITGGGSPRMHGYEKNGVGVRYVRRLSDATDEEQVLFVNRKPRKNVATKLRRRLEKFRKTLKGNVAGPEESGDERDDLETRKRRFPSESSHQKKSRSVGEGDSPRMTEGLAPPRRLFSDVDQHQYSVREVQQRVNRERANSAATNGSEPRSSFSGERSGSMSSADGPRLSVDSTSLASVESNESTTQRRALTRIYEILFGMASTDATHLPNPPRTASEGASSSSSSVHASTPLKNVTRMRSASSMSLGKVDGEIDVNELVRIHDNLLMEIDSAKRAKSGRWWNVEPSLNTSAESLRRSGQQPRLTNGADKIAVVPILDFEDEQVVADEIAAWAMRIPWIGDTTGTFIGSTAVLVWKIGYVLSREIRSNIWLHLFYAMVVVSVIWARS
ncbi:hypothetical protein DFJ77DRAFT_451412 [Powellomyces hirtus]|nr:hypothetical protein DFJ77DRAFT_451412 [Powellomyces hirtus]